MIDVPRDVTLDQLKAAIKGHQTSQRGVLIALSLSVPRRDPSRRTPASYDDVSDVYFRQRGRIYVGVIDSNQSLL
jgi:hypothetical protein